MRTTEFRLVPFVLAAALAAAPGLACAQSSSVEAVASIGGRVIGAAKSCGINAERIRRTSERLMWVVDNRAATQVEKDAAREFFVAGQTAGAKEVRYERSKCQSIHVDFSEIEVKLGRAPTADRDPLAVKRGVPALGALKPNAGATTRKE